MAISRLEFGQLPLARNGILACATLIFMTSFGEYIHSKSIFQESRPAAGKRQSQLLCRPNSRGWNSIMTCMAIYVTPILAVFVLLQRRIVPGLTSGALN